MSKARNQRRALERQLKRKLLAAKHVADKIKRVQRRDERKIIALERKLQGLPPRPNIPRKSTMPKPKIETKVCSNDVDTLVAEVNTNPFASVPTLLPAQEKKKLNQYKTDSLDEEICSRKPTRPAKPFSRNLTFSPPHIQTTPLDFLEKQIMDSNPMELEDDDLLSSWLGCKSPRISEREDLFPNTKWS